jgi:hypothetical protein
MNSSPATTSKRRQPICNPRAFIAVMNKTIKRQREAEEVDKMYQAWCKSMQLQLALWIIPYTDMRQAANEW